jgi:hypothetical protein
MSDGKRLERPRRTPCQSVIADAGNPRRIGVPGPGIRARIVPDLAAAWRRLPPGFSDK